MGAPIKADDLWGQWGRNQWKPHYLFTGQEDFLIEQAVSKAIQHWSGEKPDPLSIDKLDADSHSVDEIIQALQTVSFFSGPRTAIIQNASQITAKEQEALVPTLKSLTDTHVLFIWGKEWRRDDAQKPLVEALTHLGHVVIFWPLFPAQAERWAVDRAKHYKKSLDSHAAHWLVQQSGESLRLLDQELAKCAAFVGERPALELEDVQNCFGYSKASSPFDWLNALRRQDEKAAIHVLGHLLDEGEEPVKLLALFSRSLRDWLSAKGSGENAAMMALRFHVRRGEENRFMQELGRWDVAQLTEAIRLCVEAEESIKSGKETPEMALTLLTLGLGRSQSIYASR
jgi:DNA polymerase III subunit delta